MTKTDIVKDAIRRFNHLPKRTIARYILHNYGPLFDGNVEKIRSAIRYQTGQLGDAGREKNKNKIEHSPQKLPPTWRKVVEPYHLPPGLWLVIADLHIPFHEPLPIEAAIKYGQAEKITGILLDGDIQDCAAVSFWPSAAKRDFDKEIELFIDFFDFLEAEFPGVKIVYKPGNHEYRLPRYFQARAPEMIGMPLKAVEAVLGLEYRGIEQLEYKQVVMAGELPIFHGDEFRRIDVAVNPARGLFMRAKQWALCAHCHRTSENSTTNASGTYLTTWSIGCLCDLHPEYNPIGNDWNWGFATVNVEKSGDFEVVNRRVLPDGRIR